MSTNDQDLQKRIGTMEEQLVHLERFVEQLNMVVIEQSRQIQKMEKKMELISDKLEERKEAGPIPHNAPPPHYDVRRS
ncbi:MAG: SlyX family protein [Verrucomicrobia bacterium]|nr:SlyX family protein [Verrucomicrobiota bacterium]